MLSGLSLAVTAGFWLYEGAWLCDRDDPAPGAASCAP